MSVTRVAEVASSNLASGHDLDIGRRDMKIILEKGHLRAELCDNDCGYKVNLYKHRETGEDKKMAWCLSDTYYYSTLQSMLENLPEKFIKQSEAKTLGEVLRELREIKEMIRRNLEA